MFTDGEFLTRNSADSESLQKTSIIRDQLITKVLFVIAVFALPILALSLYRARDVGWQNVMFLHVALVILILTTAVSHRLLSFRLRAFIIIGVFFTVGVGGLMTWGLSGFGLLSLIICHFIVALCFTSRVSIISLVLCIGVMITVAVAVNLKWIAFNVDFNTYSILPSSWAIIIIATAAFMTLSRTSMDRLYSSLTQMIHAQEEQALKLRSINEKLKTEISERMKGQRSLRKSEEKYRLIVDNASEGMIILQDNIVVFVNNFMIKTSGFTHAELVHKNFIDFVHLDDRKSVYNGLRKYLKDEQVNGELECRLMDKRGNYRWVRCHCVTTEWNGRRALLAFTYEINDYKKAEEEKAELRKKLERARKMEAIGTLAGGVAHDLNNVMIGIVSYPDLLLMQLSEDSPLRKPVLTMKKTGEKATAIVQDLLTLARRGVGVADVTCINAIISDYLRSPEFEKMLSFHPDVTVETDLAPDPSNIVGSPVHLSKTIMNLVSNAAEAMPSGGIIGITTKNENVASPIMGYENVEQGEYSVISISDTGIGFSPDDRERIFEPFYTKKVMGRSGTGLGMAVVWGTVKDHHGYIDVRSIQGKGTTVTLYFPQTTNKAAHKKINISWDNYRGNGESILVVDDVLEQREFACTALSQLGYTVSAVSSGDEAIEYVKKDAPQLLILDMIMDPGIDGLETYKQILNFNPGQKTILISGFSETDRVKEARHLGAGAFIKKPYDLEDIGMAARMELDK